MNQWEPKAEEKLKRFEELEQSLSDPAVLSDRSKMADLSKKHSDLLPLIQDYRSWLKLQEEIKELKTTMHSNDAEWMEMAQMELEELRTTSATLSEKIKEHLTPKDPMAHRNTIFEIRAGTGGEEAAIFAGDLFRMYSRYAENNRWSVEILNSNATGKGGYKEIIFMVQGDNVFARMRYEGGTHRVQRVPETEASGRIHT